MQLDCGDVALGSFVAYGVVGLLLEYIKGWHTKDGQPPGSLADWMPSVYTPRGRVWWGISLVWIALFPFLLMAGIWLWTRYCP